MPAALALSAAASTAVPASAAERRYTVTDFDKVQVEGPFKVVLTTGRSPSVRASGSPRALELIAIDVQSRTLRVRANRSAWGGYPGQGAGPLRIDITTHELRGGSVHGSGSLSIDKVEAMRFDALLSGSGLLSIGGVKADNLIVTLVGSGKIQLAGKTKDLKATVQGSGDLDAAGLAAADAQIVSDTSGTIGAAVSRTVKLTTTATGDVQIAGSPACTITARGSGHVTCGED